MRENACVTAATNDDDDSVVKMEERVLKIQFKRGKFKFQVVKIVVIEFGIHMVDNFSVQVNTIIRSLRFLGPQMASFLLLALTIR